MKRGDFVKNLLAIGGLRFMPAAKITHYKKYYLYQSFVRGFRFYAGPKLLGNMHEGDMLELVREPENEYDPNAVALHWNQQKIGYLPAERNEIMSRLLDIGTPELSAEISFLKTEAAPWENVHLAIYVLKAVEHGQLTQAENLTVLETPRYRSIKHPHDMVSKVEISGDEDEDVGVSDYYSYLVENSKDDSIYNHIHTNLSHNSNFEAQGDFLVVDMKKIAGQPSFLQHLQQIESTLYDASAMFKEEDYMVLNVNKAESLISKIEGLAEVTDKLGRRFIELQF